MLKNYLTIIGRNLARRPGYAILNLSCLAVGIAATLFILLYLDFELNYDRSHENADRIYRVATNTIRTNEKDIDVEWQGTPAPLGNYSIQDYPEVENRVRFFQFFQEDDVRFEYEGEDFREEAVIAVDPSLLDVFSFELIAGNPAQALDGPNKMIISEDLARRIFGEEDPVGKVLQTTLTHSVRDTTEDYALTVTGVFRNLPRNSHLDDQALISAQTDPELDSYYFNRFSFSTYLLLQAGTDQAAFAPKLTEIYENYLDSNIDPVLVSAVHDLVPLTEIHLRTTNGATYLYIFGAVGLLLLLIASISYVNLVTAQGSRRALEIGIRKVMGSDRRQLITQFLSESVAFSLLAMGLGLVLVSSFVHPLNILLDLQLDAHQLWQPQLMAGMLGILLFIGIFGGSYPAFFLASFEPIAAIKGDSTKGAPLRRILVAVQFAVVVFVLTSTGMIYEQLQFMRQKDLGFDQEHIVRLMIPGDDWERGAERYQEQLTQHPRITSVGASTFTPGAGGMSRRPISANGTAGQEAQFVYFGSMDYQFLETMDIDLIAGRNFSREFPADAENHVIVNQAFIRNFGLPEPAIGEEVRHGGPGNPNFLQIIGVVEDFHQGTLHEPIGAQIFYLNPTRYLSVKIDEDLVEGMAFLENSWAKTFPDDPFEFQFLDETIQAAYEADQRRGKIFVVFSLFTVFIAFLGLFGLASYMAGRRVREIGIRKVFGANQWDVVLLMTRNFLVLVVLAALPAFGFAWYVIRRWLENFAFQTEMNYGLFALVLLFTIILTFFTTGLHAMRAARMNPAKTLKYE